MLCAVHHRLIHHSHWEIRMLDGLPEFIPPSWIDRTRTPRRRPPPLLQRGMRPCARLPIPHSARWVAADPGWAVLADEGTGGGSAGLAGPLHRGGPPCSAPHSAPAARPSSRSGPNTGAPPTAAAGAVRARRSPRVV
jgi:hypothetical protein